MSGAVSATLQPLSDKHENEKTDGNSTYSSDDFFEQQSNFLPLEFL